MKRKAILLGWLSLPLLCLLALASGRYIFVHEPTDDERWEKVEVGMTLEEVTALMGRAPDVDSDLKSKGEVFLHVSCWQGKPGETSEFVVGFKSGKVWRKRPNQHKPTMVETIKSYLGLESEP